MVIVFLSLPMSGRTDDAIKAQIEEMQNCVRESHAFGNDDIYFVHNFGCSAPKTKDIIFTEPLWYLGHAITMMAVCNAVYLGKGSDISRGCQIEYDVALTYGIPIYVGPGCHRLK